MKIYADSYYLDFLPLNSFIEIDSIDTIPAGADIIAVTCYTGDPVEHQRIIDCLLPKTKKLFVTLIEAINHDFVNFLEKNNNPKIEFFVDADFDQPIANVKTITSWFMCPTNFYVTSPQARSLLEQLTHNVNKPKLFDCLLGTKKSHRDQIEKFYKKTKHQEKFIFSYFKDNIHNGHWHMDLPDNIKFTANSINYQGWSTPLSALLPVDIYNQTHYSVVAETTTFNSHNEYSEKLAKPLVAQRLFVAFAGRHYLRNLRRKGFQTFDGIIDESYDDIEDDRTRFALAWQQVEYLCCQDPVDIQHKIKNIVAHNQQHFLTTNWHANMMLTLSYHSGARLP